VAILGPFTLARPWVVLAAALVGVVPSTRPAAIALTLLSCAGVLATGAALDRAYTDADPTTPPPPIPGWQRVLELGRPLLLLFVFLLLTDRFGWYAAPFAPVVVFAFAILVHDLIHNALYLPGAWSRVVLSVFAQFLIKSGHSLRTSHVQHHQKCLRDDDEEGKLVRLPVWRLVLTGPVLALRARWTAFRDGGASRPIQLLETALNGAVFGALVLAAWRGSIAALAYLGAVVLVTLTAPIWGAKIPHSLPGDHPVVVWLKDRVGRFTPAACSVVFHELHHRSPRIPVALLALHREEISARPPSPCEDEGPKGS
jgi:fatty acid desaturase